MIYVHVPFCKGFCTYCDFYSEICSGKVQKLFVEELCREIERRRSEIEGTVALNTLYIGGGTPSVLAPELMKRIADKLGYGPYQEFTVEVNPDDITPDYAVFLKSLGVTRVSMGVQSFNDDILRWMNRRHDGACAREAFRRLRQAGFDNISIDLIYGLSQLTSGLWEETLDQALELVPEHISAYQLTVEEGSALAEMIEAGIDSFKIEGRMKTALYVATVARTYRRAIDDYLTDPEIYRGHMPWYLDEIGKCTHRQYTTGFYFGKPSEETQIYDSSTYVSDYVYLGTVREVTPDGRAVFEQKNKFCKGDRIELMKRDCCDKTVQVIRLQDEDGNEMESCPHSRQIIYATFSETPEAGDIMRVASVDD